MKSLTRDLSELNIKYMLLGGVALNILGYERQTRDIDVLIEPMALAKFRKAWVGQKYIPAYTGSTKKFIEAVTKTPLISLLLER